MMNNSYILALLKDLKQPDEKVRQQATQQLWRFWFEQNRTLGLTQIRRSEA